MKHKNVIAIIPARAGSKRLRRKNIQPLLGKPLVLWVVDAAAQVIGLHNVYVSTDSTEIANIVRHHGANVINRPFRLAQDHVTTEPVIRHALDEIRKDIYVDLVLWLNASIPEIKAEDIEEAIEKLETNNLWEVFVSDTNGICNSAVRVLSMKALDNRGLSVHCGIITRDYMDIHYEEDLKTVEEKLKEG